MQEALGVARRAGKDRVVSMIVTGSSDVPEFTLSCYFVYNVPLLRFLVESDQDIQVCI